MQKIRLILKSEMIKNVLTLFTGTALAQAVPLILAPVISRIYTDTDFAMFADYISIFSLLSVISTGRYSLAIVPVKDSKDAVNILALSFFVSVFVSILSLVLLAVLHEYIAAWLDNAELGKWLFFIPVGVFFAGSFEALTYWLNRKQKYKGLAGAKISQSTSIGILNIVLGLLKFKKTGLILSRVTGDLIAGLTAGGVFLKSDRKELKHISKK